MESTEQKMTEAVKHLVALPDGIRESLFDGTLREYEGLYSFVGKTYDIRCDIYEEGSPDNKKEGEAHFIAVFSREHETYYFGVKLYLYVPCDGSDLDMGTNFRSLKNRFRAYLGPVSKLFVEVEVPHEVID